MGPTHRRPGRVTAGPGLSTTARIMKLARLNRAGICRSVILFATVLSLNGLFVSSGFGQSTGSGGLNAVRFLTGQTWATGLHLLDSTQESLIMGRDGALHTIDHSQRKTHLRVADEPFRVASAIEMRNGLQAEFGRDFEVIATPSFLVVQPRGRGKRWPVMFEQSHRSFSEYMRRRGVQVREGRFPMVAVVLPDARAMYAEFDRLGLEVSRVAGLYSNRCNRVMTHDGGQLESIVATVRHEAAHQSAFNTGVHSRVNDTPSWITEGIGQMFEPATLATGMTSVHIIDRANLESLDRLAQQGYLSDPEMLHSLVQEIILVDQPFKDADRVHDAYAMAWGMMFYLSEREPGRFAEMLNFTATRPPFINYSRSQRQIDFERVMDQDTRTFSLRLLSFLRNMR